MPPDPKRPIEELLEASAKARRAEFGADPAMPNPMRARLQDEIARVNRTGEPRPRRSWLAMFWPRFSLATAAAAVLLTSAVMWLGHKSESARPAMQVAMNDTRSREAAPAPVDALRSLDVAPQSASEPPAATAPSSEFGYAAAGSVADSKSAAIPAESETRPEVAANEIQKFAEVAVAAAPPVASLEKASRDEDYASRSDKPAPEVASAMTAPAQRFAARAGAAAGADRAKEGTAKNANLQQQFSQTTRGQALRNNVKQVPNILENFQVEQDGRAIRLVDADGSTYVGKFEPVAQTNTRRMLKMKDAAPAPASATAPIAGTKSDATQNELFFRASGFNSSLKKRVVFEGNYIPLPQTPATAKAAESKKSEGAEQSPARIVGTAKVPGELPVEVDAASVTR